MSKYSYVKFINPTDRDFVGKFDQETYVIKAGEAEYYPPFLSKHFAKHLADREMILKHGNPMFNNPVRNAFILQCLDMADERTMETLEKMSLKEEIEKQRMEMKEQGKFDDKEALKKEILGDEMYEELQTTGKIKSKGGRPKKLKQDS